MSNDPHIVPLAKVLDFLRDIGLDPVVAEDLASVHFDPGAVTVVRYRRNEAGRHYAAGDEIATETTVIRYEERRQEPVVLDVTQLNDAEPQREVGYR